MSNSDLAVTMYESDPMVAALNKVPGFDPLKLMSRKRIPEAEKDEKSLDFRYKKLWFRLAHRTGRIRLNRLSITEQLAIIEAQVYLELTDANPVSSFTAACTREEGGDKYIESAQIRAMDQALTDAGFGLQFVPAPVGSMENTAPQAAGPVVNMQMPKVPQPVMQQVQQATVPQSAVPQQRTVAAQTTPQQRAVPQQAGAQQKTVAAQAAPQQAVAQQRTVAAQTTPQQRAVPQQAVVQQKTVATQITPQQRAVPQQAGAQQKTVAVQAAPQQRTTAQQSAVQQQTAVSQQRSVAQQAAVQSQAVRQYAAPQAAAPNKPAQTAQVQAQTVQAGQKRAAIPAQAGMQTAAVSPVAPAASQKAAVPVSTLQTAAQQPVNAETLPVGQPPITAEAQELPATSDIAAAMSLLSGNKEDTLPVAPAGMKEDEKAESMPQELPVAPAAPAMAVSGTSNTVSASEMPAAPAPAANAGGAADEGRPYTEETPVEEILQFMTLKDAKKVVVSAGTCRGQTIAEVAQRRPFSLKFYLSEAYQGRDNILRAAARLMLDNLEKKAG